MRALLIIASMGMLAAAQQEGTKRDQEPSPDIQLLQGEWQSVEFQARGQKWTGSDARNRRLIFRGDEVVEVWFDSGYGIGRESERRFRLDPSRSPREIDITITWLDEKSKAETRRGIYSLENDRLTICIYRGDGDKRPADFKTSEGDGCELTVYERVRSDPRVTLEYAKIQGDWSRQYLAWLEADQKVKTAAERRKVQAELAPKPQLFAERYLKLAETQPDGFVSLAALCWAAFNAPASEPGKRALALLEEGRIARADLGDLERAFDVAQTTHSTRPKQLAPLVLGLVKQQMGHPRAVHLLVWVCTNSIYDDSPEVPPAFAKAADLIVSRFADSGDIYNFCESLGMGNGSPPWAGKYEKHLRTILEKNSHRVVRNRARFALASIAQSGGEVRQDEAERLYQQFIDEFKDPPEGGSLSSPEQQLLRHAQGQIEEIRLRGLGKPAPELAGEDLDGRPMKLSDFRGKVVLVSFWATWCGPCMKMVPHEKALVARLRDKPFALVGVNGDNEPEELQKGIEKYGIDWRSFKNKQTDKRFISTEWKVIGWPTLYLIDHQGIIRKRWIGDPSPEVLDREIDHLVEAAVRAR
jgi:uncharacterized protein (TIGR03067 family)